MGGGGWWVVVPSDYFVSTQLQLWLFCCLGCGCCWAVTIKFRSDNMSIVIKLWTDGFSILLNHSVFIEEFLKIQKT